MTGKPVVHKLNAYTFLGRRAECAVTSERLNDTEDWSKVTCVGCLAARPTESKDPMSEVSSEAVEALAAVVHKTTCGIPAVCSLPYGTSDLTIARDALAWLEEHQPARVAPSAEEVRAVTREHTIRDRQPYGWGCWGCDWTGDSAGHATHVGDAVLALFAQQPTVQSVREQVAEDLRRFADTTDPEFGRWRTLERAAILAAATFIEHGKTKEETQVENPGLLADAGDFDD